MLQDNRIVVVTRDISSWWVWTHTKHLVVDRLERGYEIVIVAPSNPFWQRVTYHELSTVWRTFITKELFFFFQARRVIDKNKLGGQVIVAQFNFRCKWLSCVYHIKHTLHAAQITALRKARFSWRNVIWIIFHWFYRIFDNCMVRYAAKTVFVSIHSQQLAKKLYPSCSKTFYFVPNFIDTKRFPSREAKDVWILRKKMNMPEWVKNFLYVWRLEPLKGIDQLIEGLKMHYDTITSTIWPFCLHVAWDGILKDIVTTHDFVNYLWKVPYNNVPYLYLLSDVFLFFSLYENSPTVILEAMSSGMLILTTNVGDVDVFLSHDSDQIIQTMDTWIEQLLLLCTLSEPDKQQKCDANREKVTQHFEMKIVLDMLHNVLFA